MITIRKVNNNDFEITVGGRQKTMHRVNLKDAYHHKLTSGHVSKEALIEKSFEFLLERESNTMILKKFDLPLIGHYFPEFEKEIKSRM